MTNKTLKLGDRDGENGITSSELEYILDVNKKAIEIQIEVAKQNEQILDFLKEIKGQLSILYSEGIEVRRISEMTKTTLEDEIQDKVDEMEKALFRLTVVLSSATIGAILTIIQAFLHNLK
jgi:hypothetical protein